MTQLTLNGAPKSTDAKTLEDAITEFGFGGARVATAVNGDFVPAAQRANVVLKDGDQLEVLAPMQGG